MAEGLSLRDLRVQARKAGVDNYRDLSTVEELQAAIAEATGGEVPQVEATNSNTNGSDKISKVKPKATKTKAKAKAKPKAEKTIPLEETEPQAETPKRRGRPPKPKSETDATPKRRGRPPKPESEKKVPVRKGGSPGRPKGTTTGTRNALPSRMKFSAPASFRDSSIAGAIFSELKVQSKQHKDTRELVNATVESLTSALGNDPFVFKHRDTGRKMNKADSMKMLRFRVNRTLFDYARASGQHESAPVIGGEPKQVKSDGTKRRGRPPKAEAVTEEAPKTRGRPKKVSGGKKK